MARFCVRHNGAKTSVCFGHAPFAPKSDLFKGSEPSHACRPGPPVETPGRCNARKSTRGDSGGIYLSDSSARSSACAEGAYGTRGGARTITFGRGPRVHGRDTIESEFRGFCHNLPDY